MYAKSTSSINDQTAVFTDGMKRLSERFEKYSRDLEGKLGPQHLQDF
jgi:hypothetical protein